MWRTALLFDQQSWARLHGTISRWWKLRRHGRNALAPLAHLGELHPALNALIPTRWAHDSLRIACNQCFVGRSATAVATVDRTAPVCFGSLVRVG